MSKQIIREFITLLLYANTSYPDELGQLKIVWLRHIKKLTMFAAGLLSKETSFMYKMSFNNQPDLIALDFVDGNKGLLYLRYAGPETLVNAAWAFLVSDKSRENKYISQVIIDGPERKGCALYKGIRYKSIKAKLSNGYIDTCLIHPKLTISQDTSDSGFYMLTYEEGVPSGFYERLNKTLGIPLKPEWLEWLWLEGQRQQSFTWQITRSVYENGKAGKKLVNEDDSAIPIVLLESLGNVRCFEIHTAHKYKHAWHAAIRNYLI